MSTASIRESMHQCNIIHFDRAHWASQKIARYGSICRPNLVNQRDKERLYAVGCDKHHVSEACASPYARAAAARRSFRDLSSCIGPSRRRATAGGGTARASPPGVGPRAVSRECAPRQRTTALL